MRELVAKMIIGVVVPYHYLALSTRSQWLARRYGEMRGSIKNRLGWVGKNRRGFTLIEMLVVVGIIVALAAIIVPLVISFAGSGEQAAQAGEVETAQTAIQSLMVDNDLFVVTASTSGVGGEKINSTGTQFNATINIQPYMDQPATQYCYRWGTDGRITFQYDLVAGACGAAGVQLYP